MKVVLLHGPAINSSRKKLQELRRKFAPDNVMVFEKGADTGEILTNLKSQSLFDGERLIIVENPQENLFLDSSPFTLSSSFTLVLWFDHEIETSVYAGAEVLFFPELMEVSVFPFLDNLAYRDKKAFLELDKLNKSGFDSQYLITMVLYLLRSLTVTPTNAPQFVKNKLVKQQANFPPERLTAFYKFVLALDFKIKSGDLDENQVQFLLVQRFVDFGLD